jgi:hypothetical protein
MTRTKELVLATSGMNMSLILRNLNFELILHYFQAVRTNLSIDTFSDHRIWIRIA